MLVKVDYYTSLVRALDGIADDSPAARREVYARARKDLARSVSSTGPSPGAANETADRKEELEEAIRKIESERGTERPQEAKSGVEKNPPEQKSKPLSNKKSRSVFARVFGRMAIAVVLFAVSMIGYLHLTGEENLSFWLSDRVGNRPPPASAELTGSASAQRAVLYVEDANNPVGREVRGRALWDARATGDPAGEIALLLEVEIPERDLAMSLRMHRNSGDGSTISHLVQFKFTTTKKLATDEVASVIGIVMKHEERASGILLTGQVVTVTTGVFLLGLSGADVERNLRLLRERDWLDIAIVYKNGSRNILAIEKGQTGTQAVQRALNKWAQM